ncbi:polysaccharide deacetylase family protein [Candidatus Woesearchaeota archaeon]|nr:polysaccharide deacetylase family protein [Candidatus Woesearchaeota archaeon]
MNQRIMTVDLEPDLRSTSCKSLEVIPKLLELFDEFHIKSTFFVVSSLLEKHESIIKDISKKHEIASHSHTHSWLNPVNASWEMQKSKEELQKYGHKVEGFRAPGFVITSDHFQLLKDHKYTYDASLARYFPGRCNNMLMPRKPFVKDRVREFPMPTFIYPSLNAGLPYLKLFHPVSTIFPKPYMFYLHPWELMEKKELTEPTTISKMLQRNTGEKAWRILRNYLERCEEGEWVGCEGWKGGKF